MKIYTRTGDDGSTGLFGGGRVAKDALRVEAYGSVDETNAVLGVARSTALPAELDALLAELQIDLFAIGAELACAPGNEGKLGDIRLDAARIERLEQAIDAQQAELPALQHFVLPAGSPSAAALHLARTVCRRAERQLVALARVEPVRADLIVYLNRLSDLLFVMARTANRSAGVPDVPWLPRAR